MESIYPATGGLVASVTQGSDSFTVSVPVGTPVGSPVLAYTWTYSVSGVPAGSYAISLSFNTGTRQSLNGTYDFNGAGSLPVTVQESGGLVRLSPYTYTVSSPPNVVIAADAQLDAHFF